MTRIARIEGYASLFNVPDLNGDTVLPGAFAASLARARNGLPLLYQHEAATPLGRWTHLKEDSRGLYVRGVLLLDSPKAREVHALIAGAAIDGLSIGFRTVRARRHARRAGRFIEAADLWEVSVVTFPMAPGARVLALGAPAPASEAISEPSPPAPAANDFAGALRAAARIVSNPPAHSRSA